MQRLRPRVRPPLRRAVHSAAVPASGSSPFLQHHALNRIHANTLHTARYPAPALLQRSLRGSGIMVHPSPSFTPTHPPNTFQRRHRYSYLLFLGYSVLEGARVLR